MAGIVRMIGGTGLALVAATAAPAQEQAAADIDAFAARAVEELGVPPGLALAVVRGDEVVLAQGYGHRDVAAGLPVEAGTVFYIASSTKSFTGLLAALLDHRGTIDLDARVDTYLPEVGSAGPDSLDPPTLRQLLTHTAGRESFALVFRTAFSGEHDPATLLELVRASDIVEPGFAYDNYGYVVATMALERAAGASWKDLLAREIFEPLGMTRTTAYVGEIDRSDFAAPYGAGPDGDQRIEFLKVDATLHAAGGLMSTAEDLARFLAVQLNDGRLDGRQVLPAEALREAHRMQAELDATFWQFHRTGYGLGWYGSDYEGDTLLHHFGSFAGYRAHLSFMPEHDVGVAVLINSDANGFFVPDLVATYAYDRLLEKPGLEARYEAALDEYAAKVAEQRVEQRAELEERAGRPWMLDHPLASYVGTYVSDAMGTMRIEERDGRLVASVGILSAPLDPFTEPESARVELVPGMGSVIRFEVQGGRATALTNLNHTWTRTGEGHEGGAR